MTVPKAILGTSGASHLAAKAAYRRSVAAPPAAPSLGTSGRNPSGQRTHVRVQVQVRRAKDDNWVEFDGEEQWDDDDRLSGSIGTALSGPILQQATRAVGLVVDRLTDVALQFAPEDASPGAVRAAVAGGLVLVALSFVKGVLSFILTIGTVFFGAFVAVRVFGWDAAGSLDSGSGRGSGGGGKGRGKKRTTSNRQPERPRGRSGGDDLASGVAGLLGSVLSAATSSSDSADDGLIDVWFEGSKGKKKKAPAPKKKR